MTTNPTPTNPAVELVDLSYRYPTSEADTLRGISFSVCWGECICLSGPSGCGKSTLLLAISGLLNRGEIRGEVRINGCSPGVSVGMVFQNAESQILSTTVGDEVAFGPTNLNAAPGDIERNVRTALEAVGLAGYETRNVEALSAGEKQRLTIASVLSMQPPLLFLDEPSAQLDRRGKEALRVILKRLKESLFTILVADHDTWAYNEVADRFIFMNDGRIEKEKARCRPPEMSPGNGRGHRAVPTRTGTDPVIVLDRVGFSHRKGQSVVTDLSIEVRTADRIHIFGENGAGKSTLFRLITGLLRPDTGRIEVLGLSQPSPERLKGKVGLLLQNPVRQLFENTVREEAAFALRRQGLSSSEIDSRVADSLTLCGIGHLIDRSPFTLSFGEKHRVTLASLIALKPRVLLLDEPFSGLDFPFRRKMLDTLRVYGERHNCAMIAASHDALVDPEWADRSFVLQHGKLMELSAP